MPLFVRGSFVGLILADNLITRKPIAEEDLSLLKTFAGYAGVALERSHLYDELRENVAKLQSANETLKKNQEKLLQAEKLSAIGKLAAYVSHEIRNPLVAIGGLARSLLKDPIQDGETVETLEIIVSEVSRLERFLRETLDFVKPRFTGRACVDLKGIVMDCLATYRKEIEHRAIEIHEEIASPAPRCWIDPDLLRHALCDITSRTAIEAMEGGGILQVRVERSGETALDSRGRHGARHSGRGPGPHSTPSSRRSPGHGARARHSIEHTGPRGQARSREIGQVQDGLQADLAPGRGQAGRGRAAEREGGQPRARSGGSFGGAGRDVVIGVGGKEPAGVKAGSRCREDPRRRVVCGNAPGAHQAPRRGRPRCVAAGVGEVFLPHQGSEVIPRSTT